MTQPINNLLKREERLIESIGFPSSGFVRLKQILAPEGPLPISRSGFWAGVKVGRFPQPRKISPRVTVWRAEDIHALLATIEQGGLSS